MPKLKTSRPTTNNQGKCIVERCGECDYCQEWMLETTQAKRGLPCTNLLVMFPDGTVKNGGSKWKTEKLIKAWFAEHANDDAFNVGVVEWRQYTGSMDG